VPDKELRRRLEELHRELASADSVDTDVQALLEELRGDIEAVLERSEPEGFGERLSGLVERFEATHPKLSNAIGAVVDQLARLGI